MEGFLQREGKIRAATTKQGTSSCRNKSKANNNNSLFDAPRAKWGARNCTALRPPRPRPPPHPCCSGGGGGGGGGGGPQRGTSCREASIDRPVTGVLDSATAMMVTISMTICMTVLAACGRAALCLDGATSSRSSGAASTKRRSVCENAAVIHVYRSPHLTAARSNAADDAPADDAPADDAPSRRHR